MGNAGAEAAAAAGGAAEDGPGAAAEAGASGAGPAHYDQDPTKTLVQTGRQVELDVASAIVCVTKPTWNMERRQREQQRPGPTCPKR